MMEVRLGDFVGVWHFDGGLRLDGPCVPDQDLQVGGGGPGVGDGQGGNKCFQLFRSFVLNHFAK